MAQRYVARFYKDVAGANGRDAVVCQAVFELFAQNSNEAADRAKHRFCEERRLSDWHIHADRLKLVR